MRHRSQRTSKCGKNISDTLGCASCATFLFLPHFDVICDLLLNRRTTTWNLFVNLTMGFLNSPIKTLINQNLNWLWPIKIYTLFRCGVCTTLRHTTVFTYSHANTLLGQSERAYYLSYFINNNTLGLLSAESLSFSLGKQPEFFFPLYSLSRFQVLRMIST